MAQRWLVKTEPESYSFADLVRDKRTTWDGVRNPVAQAHMRLMRPGDAVFVYHTGKEKAVVGIAKVAKAPVPDPVLGGKAVSVDLEPVRALPAAVPLATIRLEPTCDGLPIVRQPRLSVMPMPEAAWDAIERRAVAR